MACTSLVTLIVRSLRVPDPIIDFRLFANWAFVVSMLVTASVSIAQYARVSFLALELELVHGLDVQRVGLVLAPAGIGVVLTGPLGGWLTDRVGPRTPVLLGFVATAASM